MARPPAQHPGPGGVEGGVEGEAPPNLTEILERLGQIEERLGRIETAFPWIAQAAARDDLPEEHAIVEADPVRRIGQLGRTLLVLGGAYLLRSIAASEWMPPLVGLALGLLYGLFWLIPAGRHAARGRAISGAFFAASSAMIVYPVLWEGTIRFGLLSPPVAAAAIVLVTAAIGTVALQHRQAAIAWVAALGGLGLSLADALAGSEGGPYLASLALIGVGTWVIGRVRGWFLLGEVSALVVDLGALFLGIAMTLGELEMGLVSFVLLEIGICGLYGLAFVLLSRRGFELRVAELLQLSVAGTIGFGTAGLATRSAPQALAVVGWCALAAALAGLLALVLSTAWRPQFSAWTFLFLAVAGTILAPSPSLAFLVLASLALGGDFAFPRLGLRGHVALFSLLAVAASGLLGGAWSTLITGAADAGWTRIPIGWAAVAIAAALVVLRPAERSESGGRWPEILAIALATGTVLGALVQAVAGALAAPTPGVIAAIRTLSLCVAVVLLVLWARRRPATAGRLVAPLLVLIGIKIVVQDLPAGGPFTLFLALGAYGAVLVGVPPLLRRLRDPEGGEDERSDGAVDEAES